MLYPCACTALSRRRYTFLQVASTCLSPGREIDDEAGSQHSAISVQRSALSEAITGNYFAVLHATASARSARRQQRPLQQTRTQDDLRLRMQPDFAGMQSRWVPAL